MLDHSNLGLAAAIALIASCAAPGAEATPSSVDGKADRWDEQPAHCLRYDEPHKLAEVEAERAQELSGLVASRNHLGVLWSHNDSGNTRHLIAFDTDGQPHGNYKLVGSENRDWEDIAIGPGPYPYRDYLYVADIGDNERERKDVVVYRIVEPDVGGIREDTIDLEGYETFELEYGDGDEHDAESFAVDPQTGSIFIVTKSQKGDRDTMIFVADGPFEDGEKYELHKAADEDDYDSLKGQAAAADFSAAGTRLGLLFDDRVAIWTRPFEGWSTETLSSALSETPCLGPVPDEHIESFTWAIDRPGYYLVPEGERPALYHVSYASTVSP